jgi:altronate dehydratase large subunit
MTMEFLGYPRPDGAFGIRNHVLVIPGSLVGGKISEFVPGTVTTNTANLGGGCTSRDREAAARVLIGLGRNPNVASVIVHGNTDGGGYPELRMSRLADEIAKSGKPVVKIEAAKEGGTLEAIKRGIEAARELVYEASRVRREPAPLGKLTIGVKCGSSDPTSGLAGNPAIGYLFDRVVDAGGVAMFGETTEVIGAEHIVAKRAVDDDVARELLARVRFIEERALATGEDIRTVNPVPANIAAGISTLEEKSLGAMHKSGHRPIQGVLNYAEIPSGRGLYFCDNWMSRNSIFVGYAASGAQLTLFQYGGGGVPGVSVLDPSTAVVAPLMWCTANPITRERTKGSLDYYSGTVIEGVETPDEAGERLVRQVCDIASGTLTRCETVSFAEPFEVYTIDPVF